MPPSVAQCEPDRPHPRRASPASATSRSGYRGCMAQRREAAAGGATAATHWRDRPGRLVRSGPSHSTRPSAHKPLVSSPTTRRPSLPPRLALYPRASWASMRQHHKTLLPIADVGRRSPACWSGTSLEAFTTILTAIEQLPFGPNTHTSGVIRPSSTTPFLACY